jgi:hypothetical protein
MSITVATLLERLLEVEGVTQCGDTMSVSLMLVEASRPYDNPTSRKVS